MLREVIRTLYNKTVRPYLPRKISIYAGVPVRSAGLFDMNDHHPNYKKGLIDAISETISNNDTVVLVGFGRGVSAVHCLRSGASEVIAYEAATQMCELGRETLELTGDSKSVDINHAIVGEEINVYGDSTNAAVVTPDNLKYGDVLLLDCEGAEASILGGLDWRPGSCIIETHPERGVPTEKTASMLTDLGYDVRRKMYEPEQNHESKRILVGTSPEGQ